MIIDEPAEEEAGEGADGDNGGDDAGRGTVLVSRECRHGGKAKIIDFLLLPNGPEQSRACSGSWLRELSVSVSAKEEAPGSV